MREEFVSEYLWKLVRSGGEYEHKYLLGTSIARPLLAKKQVEVALATGCDAVAHGCTGKGNDQVRFELTYKALAPQLGVIAPWREWEIVSREDAVEYCRKRNVPITASMTKIYSRDRNIWHISHEGGALEDPANAAPDDLWMLTKSPAEAPNTPGEVTIGFEKGVPVSVNGKRMKAFELLETLNKIGAEHAIGRIDLVENRFVGMKSRGCYETPGGTLIMFAVRELKRLRSIAARCTTSSSGRSSTPRWCTTACGSRRCARRSTASSKRSCETQHRRDQAAIVQGQHRAAQPHLAQFALFALHR